MENHAFPLIGSKPADQMDSNHMAEVLTPIRLEIPDTARKPRAVCRACPELHFGASLHGFGRRASLVGSQVPPCTTVQSVRNRLRNAIPSSGILRQKPLAQSRSKGNDPVTAEVNRRGRPSREEQLRREDLVLDIALQEFLAEGLNGANIETIARKAGVGKSTIYRKYVSKQGLLLAVAQRRMTELGERWGEFPFDIDDPEGTLYRIALVSYREWSGKSLPIYRIIFTEAERIPDIARAVEAMTKQSAIRPILDYFQQLQDRGVIDVKDAAEAASLFLVVAAGALRSFLMPVELDEEGRAKLAHEAVQFFLYGYARRDR